MVILNARMVLNCCTVYLTSLVLMTSWNWIFVSDFAPYKPTFIPEANNGEFDFYFDSMVTRKCYLAPERFYSDVIPDKKEVDPKMDIFSLGYKCQDANLTYKVCSCRTVVRRATLHVFRVASV